MVSIGFTIGKHYLDTFHFHLIKVLHFGPVDIVHPNIKVKVNKWYMYAVVQVIAKYFECYSFSRAHLSKSAF